MTNPDDPGGDAPRAADGRATPEGGRDALRASPMMDHLLAALERGTDVGHYGRLVFAMVARHFLPRDDIVELLAAQPGGSEARARSLLTQCVAKNYSPPKRERILQWQAEQEFPICPTPDDPQACNVYRELQFPEDVYEEIEEFWEEQAEAEEGNGRG